MRGVWRRLGRGQAQEGGGRREVRHGSYREEVEAGPGSEDQCGHHGQPPGILPVQIVSSQQPQGSRLPVLPGQASPEVRAGSSLMRDSSLLRFTDGKDKYFLTEGTGVFSAQVTDTD